MKEEEAIYDVFFPIEMTHTDESGEVKVQVTEMERQQLSAEYVEKGMQNLSNTDKAKFNALRESENGGWILVNHGTVLIVSVEKGFQNFPSDVRGFNNINSEE
tara:strand:+ start:287 stop:595 length:309 start_codon:yes stop_codon:yes gene_type:complete